MRRLIKFIEDRFYVFMLLAIFLGILSGKGAETFKPFMRPFLMGILFFTALKMDFSKVAEYARRYKLIAYIVAVHMVAVPIIAYYITLAILPEYAAGILVMAALPAGMASSTLTLLCSGEIALALMVTLSTAIAAPVTIPVLVNVLTGRIESLSEGLKLIAPQAGLIAVLLFTPVIAAFIIRKIFPKTVDKYQHTYSALSVVSLTLLIYTAMSTSRGPVVNNPKEALYLLIFIFVLIGAFYIAGYYVAPWLKRSERVAFSVTAAYVNNGLGIIFATSFFPGDATMLLPVVVIELPMLAALLPLKVITCRPSWIEAVAKESSKTP
jgi:BASS family bile acid:Na+ symporter